MMMVGIVLVLAAAWAANEAGRLWRSDRATARIMLLTSIACSASTLELAWHA